MKKVISIFLIFIILFINFPKISKASLRDAIDGIRQGLCKTILGAGIAYSAGVLAAGGIGLGIAAPLMATAGVLLLGIGLAQVFVNVDYLTALRNSYSPIETPIPEDIGEKVYNESETVEHSIIERGYSRRITSHTPSSTESEEEITQLRRFRNERLTQIERSYFIGGKNNRGSAVDNRETTREAKIKIKISW